MKSSLSEGISLNREISGRIVNEMRKKSLTAYRVAKDCGIPEASFYKMLNSKGEWRVEHLIKIAQYFGISLDQLLRGPESGPYGTQNRYNIPGDDKVLLDALKKYGIDTIEKLQDVLQPMKAVAERMAEYTHKRKGGRK